jgi:hypothetical protein
MLELFCDVRRHLQSAHTLWPAANVTGWPSFIRTYSPFCDAHMMFISGVEVFDTCGTRDVAMRDVYFAVKNALEPRGKLPLIGRDINLKMCRL